MTATTVDPTTEPASEASEATEDGAPAATSAPDDPLAELRRRPVNLHLFGGYGPLIVAVLVAALMVALLPSVAGEQIVEQPKNADTVTEATLPPGTKGGGNG